MQVRAVLMGEADRLQAGLQLHGRSAVVRLCGGDPVSRDAAAAFNHRIQGFLAEVHARVATFRAAGDALAVTAREYGHTERQVIDSYRTTASGDSQRQAP